MAHDDRIFGHFGHSKRLPQPSQYHWKNRAMDVYDYFRGCSVCQQNKDCIRKSLGEPQPLELPKRWWDSISMDFITKLPTTSSGYDCITTFVDRFSKKFRLVPSRGTDTATSVADCFFSNIFKMDRLPESIVSDRDPKFTSKSWKRMMDYCWIQLKMSTIMHPQTELWTELMNWMIGNYLWCYCAFHQKHWDTILPTA